MKNLKSILLLFCFCALITTQTVFAQEDSRAATEKAELINARNNEDMDLAEIKEAELEVLIRKYEEATPKQRVAIQEEINALKKSYDKEVKGLDGDYELSRVKVLKEESTLRPESDRVDYTMSDKDDLITDARKRIKAAKIRLVEAEESGKLTQEELSQRRDKIMLIQKKLTQYESSLSDAKEKIAERIKELKELQD